ncbi:MAG TPA: SDR family NAD(P)-dependent oxidoreductase [Sporichthyaceae bacterium]|jgi:NAD(P)-dependent dehydrogenase (short-subunit alcohol dehydrogenase family)|nr:SDR family NAD(P)-dependent oxidoreductase [Sporichthyaceae bacterium]
MTIDFTGQVAIVTGAGRGLGRSHAELLAGRGAKVVANDVAGAAEVADAINRAGGQAVASDDDISTPAGAASLVHRAADEFGGVQILINNAGVGRFTTLDHASIDEYEAVRRSGLDGTFYVTREVWPYMMEAKYGRIVVTTSGNGLLGNPSSVTYAIAKAGVYGMMRAVALDGAEFGIKANALAPMASTPMSNEFVSPEMAEMLRVEFPTSLVSPIVAVLASEQCPVSGYTFDAGGGRIGITFQGTNAGLYDRAMTPESILESWDHVVNRTDFVEFASGYESLSMVAASRERALSA